MPARHRTATHTQQRGRLGVPFGISVESVSIRRLEIEASVRLAGRLSTAVTR